MTATPNWNKQWVVFPYNIFPRNWIFFIVLSLHYHRVRLSAKLPPIGSIQGIFRGDAHTYYVLLDVIHPPFPGSTMGLLVNRVQTHGCSHTESSLLHMMCPYHLSLPSHSFAMIGVTPSWHRMSSFMVWSNCVSPRHHWRHHFPGTEWEC